MWHLRIGNMQWQGNPHTRPPQFRQPRSLGNLLFWSVIVAAAAVILLPLFLLALTLVMVVSIVAISAALAMAVFRVITNSVARLTSRSVGEPVRRNVRVIPRRDDDASL